MKASFRMRRIRPGFSVQFSFVCIVPREPACFGVASVLALLIPIRMLAQDDPNEQPLGDVARNLRKNTQVTKQVIDDDNLTQVMEQGESRHAFGSAIKACWEGKPRVSESRLPMPHAACLSRRT